MAIVELKNIRKSFGPRKVLNGVSWQLRMGEKVGLVGSAVTRASGVSSGPLEKPNSSAFA